MSLIYIIDLLGTFVFTISGALAASDKEHHHDLFSVFFTGFITAIGGGTIRDIILGAYPVCWIADGNYLLAVFAGVLFTLLTRKHIIRMSRTLSLFDTLGMAIYVIMGVEKSLSLHVSVYAAVILGMISGIFGGVTRDTLLNNIPMIFRKELYATPCLLGALLYVLLLKAGMEAQVNFIVSVLFIFIFRILAVKYKWSLPTLTFRE
ncbi:MAG TPA: trimeric intracellular cation channel family protein [Chitinophagales bacterium]|nr:trimeric intracellular cation channel family protein [Chitinophagales bacterium]HNL83936.1 trimeric intracellular cation channel family protein [Chitinophagales bacterium]